jgi:hypothetical protein
METLRDLIEKTWSRAGGIIDKSLAAQILNVTDARIAQMAKEGKLKEYPIGKKKMLSYFEVINYNKNKKSIL